LLELSGFVLSSTSNDPLGIGIYPDSVILPWEKARSSYFLAHSSKLLVTLIGGRVTYTIRLSRPALPFTKASFATMPKRSNRLFGGHSKGTASINEVNANPQTSDEKATPQFHSWNDSHNGSRPSGVGLISKIRRGKVKLLSKFGLWNSGGTEETGEYPMK
jgi:hypothetical protein